jgi:SAM-dependent methyltransferase
MNNNKTMSNIKRLIKNIPGIKFSWNLFAEYRLSKLDTESRFTNIYNQNSWGDADSLSGTGSNLAATEVIRYSIEKLITNYNIKTILDIPCGDFYWMKAVEMNDIKYIGADIVKPLIDVNNKEYSNKNRTFKQIDIITGDLPEVDLIICRDCLVHLCNEDVKRATLNIIKSKSKYLLTTTFPDHIKNNDIITGRWRPINLNITPFNFPESIFKIKEEYIEDSEFADKNLSLWRISDLHNLIL